MIGKYKYVYGCKYVVVIVKAHQWHVNSMRKNIPRMLRIVCTMNIFIISIINFFDRTGYRTLIK